MLIVFDLDGTLIDSSKDLAISMNATREHLGMAPIAPELVYSFVGNGIRVLVERALGPAANAELVERGHRFFLSHYQEHALDNTQLYPGVGEMVEKLAPRHTLAVLTNKPVSVAAEIARALQVADYFRRTYGGDSFRAKKPDPVGLLTLMQEMEVSAGETLMVGDSSVDVQTAQNAAVKSCGVLWGFQPDSLAASNPDFLIDKPDQIFSHIL